MDEVECGHPERPWNFATRRRAPHVRVCDECATNEAFSDAERSGLVPKGTFTTKSGRRI